MSALIEAYREYLDRMYDQSEDLRDFDVYSVPLELDPDSPVIQEFGHFE